MLLYIIHLTCFWVYLGMLHGVEAMEMLYGGVFVGSACVLLTSQLKLQFPFQDFEQIIIQNIQIIFSGKRKIIL